MQVYETLGFEWRGIAVTVEFCPDFSTAYRDAQGQTLCHLQVMSASRVPLPISETGYRSAFIAEAVIEAWGGPAAYVRGWLDACAREPEWIERGVKAEQLTLF
jgi:hypothetical protein